jgi:hypothetical protein
MRISLAGTAIVSDSRPRAGPLRKRTLRLEFHFLFLPTACVRSMAWEVASHLHVELARGVAETPGPASDRLLVQPASFRAAGAQAVVLDVHTWTAVVARTALVVAAACFS